MLFSWCAPFLLSYLRFSKACFRISALVIVACFLLMVEPPFTYLSVLSGWSSCFLWRARCAPPTSTYDCIRLRIKMV